MVEKKSKRYLPLGRGARRIFWGDENVLYLDRSLAHSACAFVWTADAPFKSAFPRV